jgi:hypothetical protein
VFVRGIQARFQPVAPLRDGGIEIHRTQGRLDRASMWAIGAG